MSRKYLPIVCLIALLAGCEKQKYEDFIEPDTYTTNIISYPDEDDVVDERQNLLINGGLEEWTLLTPYDIPNSWLCHNNYNVRKDFKVVYEGHCSAKMQSLEKGTTARLDQVVEVTPNKKIRIRFHYAITQWKDKGARTYCYFRTRATESSTISAESLNYFYDVNTLRIIRGGGYGLTYLPCELNKWLSFDETITVPPSANYFVFGINSYYGTTIYVDDCWITNVAN